MQPELILEYSHFEQIVAEVVERDDNLALKEHQVRGELGQKAIFAMFCPNSVNLAKIFWNEVRYKLNDDHEIGSYVLKQKDSQPIRGVAIWETQEVIA